MKKFLLLVVATMALVLAGCKAQTVVLTVTPADARVIANGAVYDCGSPIIIQAQRREELVIAAFKTGYETKKYAVDTQLSTLGKIEAWTSIMVLPAIGLFFDPAWELAENNITLELVPLAEDIEIIGELDF